MNEQNNLVMYASETEKAAFYKKTYLHLALALLAFIGVETLLIKTVPVEAIAWLFSGKFIWMFVIGLFWLGSFISTKMSFAPSR